MLAEKRERLNRQQYALIKALQGVGETPEGFDPHAIKLCTTTLREKRLRVLARIRRSPLKTVLEKLLNF
jgi:hypothetical protein